MYCEQCGAELEPNARFCSMCGSQVGEAGAESSGQEIPQGVADRHPRILKSGLIAGLVVVVLVLGGTVLWTLRSEKAHLTDDGNSLNAVTQESKTELSRNKAEKMIGEHNKFPIPVRVLLEKRKRGAMKPDDVDKFNRSIYGTLKGQGFIEYSFSQAEWMSWTRDATWQKVDIRITERAKDFLVEEEPYHYELKGCEKQLLKVSGVAPIEFGFKGAQVEYEWTYDKPTPFASLPLYERGKRASMSYPCIEGLGVPQKGGITFKLYDDGWRLDK